MSERTPQDQEKFVLRLPDGMRNRIKAVADANGRSMNAEIVVALEEKFPPPFSREATRLLVHSTLLMFNPSRVKSPEFPEGTATKVRQLMLRVVRGELNEPDPEAALSEIETTNFVGLEGVTIVLLNRWLAEMRLRYGQAPGP